MAKITRKAAKIFGENAGLNQIAKFGSLAAASPSFTTDPDTIQSLSNYLSGWFAAVIGANSPAIEDMNALCYLFAYQIAYQMQSGVSEYDSGTTYYTGSLASTTDGSGQLFVSIADNNVGNALTDSTKWVPFKDRKTIFTSNGTWVCPSGVSRATVVAEPMLETPQQQIDLGGAIDQDGQLWVWGNNENGVLGTNNSPATTPFISVPKVVAGSIKWARLATKDSDSNSPTNGAIDQSGNLWMWGIGGNGQIGNSSTTTVSSPVMVIGGYKFQKAFCLTQSVLGLTYSGNLYSWGFNGFGQLGDGTVADRSSPTLVVGGHSWKDFGSVISGFPVFLGISTDNDLYGWGVGVDGVVGNSTVGIYSSPVLVSGGIKWKKIANTFGLQDTNDRYNAAGIDTDGNIWTWGNNLYGQLGIGVPASTVAMVSSPVMVVANAKFVDIAECIPIDQSSSDYYPTFFALDTDGNIWSWGSNVKGILGIGSTTGLSTGTPTVSSPIMITSSVKFVELIHNHHNPSISGQGEIGTMYARDTSGQLWAWGDNSSGALGANLNPATTPFVSTPTLVAGGHKFVSATYLALQGHGNPGASAMDVDGNVWVWGYNGALTASYLGIGVPGSTTPSVSSPVMISTTALEFNAEQHVQKVKSIDVVPGKSYPIVVQAFNSMFSGNVIGTKGMNKLTVLY